MSATRRYAGEAIHHRQPGALPAAPPGQRRLVTGEALARQMPVFAAAEAPVTQADALLGVLNRYDQIGRFTARLALRILLEGAPPGELPIELPRQFSYLINLRVAHRLGRSLQARVSAQNGRTLVTMSVITPFGMTA